MAERKYRAFGSILVITVYITVLVALMGLSFGRKTYAEEPQALALTISLNKGKYIYKEDITVTSILQNISKETRVVKEPFGLGLIVTYDIYKIEKEREIHIPRQRLFEGGPGWAPHIFELPPGAWCSSSFDLMRLWPGGFEPGQYKIRGVYHLKDWFSGFYDDPKFLIFSDFVYFDVVMPEGKNLEALKVWQGELVLWKLDEEQSPKEFITRYPKSPYVKFVRKRLKSIYSGRKDYDAKIKLCEEILADNPSPMERAITLYSEALAYFAKGDREKAIELMRLSGLKNAEDKAERWEKGFEF